VATVGAFLLAEAGRILAQRPHVVMYGDQALLELGARRAIHLDQLLGPYSRNGFHHPGPSVFYLLAPFVRLFEPTGPGLYLGAVILNAAALVATVAVIWRRVGPLAALWAAAAIDVFCLCLGVGTLREPWNPYLVVAPMVLFVVLWAAGWTGSRTAAVWTFVVGSYLVQTEIATAAVVLVLCVSLVLRLARRRWSRGRPGPERRWGPAGVTGIVLLIGLWIPVVVELFRDRPNNLRLLWDFFTAGHAGPPLGDALRVSTDALSVLPLGNHDYVLALHRNPVAVAGFALLLVAALVVAVGVGRRRRQPMSLALAASAVVGALVGMASLTHTDGPIYLYFALWLAYVPLAALLALGVAMFGSAPDETPSEQLAPYRAGPKRAPWAQGVWAQGVSARTMGARAVWARAGWAPRAVVPLGLSAALVASAFSVGSDVNLGAINTTTGSGPWPAGNAGTAQGKQRTITDTMALTQAAESVLRPQDRWVGFNIGSDALWPYVAGLVLELDERGVQSTVGPAPWALYFGRERAPGRPVSVAFSVYPASDSSIPAGSTILMRLDGTVLAYQRLGV
jgi:hypothetical protein